ncbi:MAG: hypothetical protein H6926_00360 [Chromatiales bacterium]|nr:hypothetical protein [Gammaproteobacteria bacterium]MCP5351631.1 hypothetical protein [Chromatiales bacterium]
MSVVALRLRTAPDLDAGRRLLGLSDLEDKDVLKAMEHVQRQRHGDRDFGFALRRVVALSLVIEDGDEPLRVLSMHAAEHSERDMLAAFFEHAGVDDTVLVTWNGSVAHLPVLQTRALILDVPSGNYWHGGRDPKRHAEIAPLLTGGIHDMLDLSEVATLSGLPHVAPLSETEVRDAALTGGFESVSIECDQLALNTYLLYLRMQRIRGEVSGTFFQKQLQLAHGWLLASDRPALQAYAAAWSVEKWPVDLRAVAHGA